MEPLVALPLLTEEAGADDPPVDGHEGARGLVPGRHLADAPDERGVEHPEEDGEDEHDPEACDGLPDDVVHGCHTIPGRWLTTRSMSLMPMKGAMTPPTP